ncbi:unnamed protein product, partial [Vitis vinifera]
MRAEKQGSKSGGYVGGFFQLFDWNAKSRKKLFSNKSDLPERSKQGKKSDGNLPMTRFRLTDDDEAGATPSFKGSSDYSCGSSVTDEEGYGTRAPGVVARLMGLDSLPPSNISEPYSSPFFDSQSLRDVHYNRKNFDFHHDHQIMHSGNLLNRVDGPSRSAMDLKPPKTLSRPIEKFQTEILPPKSAKSIPSTHHKLLSPIKSPGFIPTKNAAHIMEAAAKIIEPGPQATTKAKMPLVGSPLVPLKVRDLKERMEAAQKMPLSLNKSWNGSEETTSFRGSSDTEESSAGLKNKGKSISLAIQAKVNVQRREGLNPSTNRSSVGLREQNEVKSSQPFKSQSNTQKGVHKKPSTPNAPGVLRQNNQKQNCMVDKDKLPSKSFVSTSQSRKPLSGESSLGRHKTSSKVSGNSKAGSRKLGLEPTDSEKEVSYSSTKNFPRKKRSINGDFNLENNWVADNFLIDKNEKAFQSNTVKERHFSWAEDSRKKGMDVVSFTFTAPLTRSIPGSESPSQAAMKSNGLSTDYRGKKVLLEPDAKNLSSLGINVIGGDALSMLLDQKLRELTDGVDSSRRESFKVGSTASSSILQDLAPTLNALSTTHRLHDKRDQPWLQKDKMDSLYDSDFSFTAPSAFDIKHKLQGENEMDECSSSSNAEARNLLDCRHPSPVSILEPSFSTESCNSSDSTDSNSIEGSKHFSSVLAQELISLSFSKKFNSMEADAELSDSASSTSTATVATKHVVALTATCLVRSTKWELEYVKEILCNIELMFKDFALGRAREIINPHLFHQTFYSCIFNLILQITALLSLCDPCHQHSAITKSRESDLFTFLHGIVRRELLQSCLDWLENHLRER